MGLIHSFVMRDEVRRALKDALAVVAPTECAGCGAVDRALCERCIGDLSPNPRSIEIGPRSHPLTVWASLEYEDSIRKILLAYKDGGRTDAAAPLAIPLRAAVRRALPIVSRDRAYARSPLRLVVIPSSRDAFRRRGYHPVELVLRKARLAAARDLQMTRQSVDQAGLGLHDRAVNRAGSLRGRGALTGVRYLVVDDILTTGATILEARRAIEAAGGEVIGAATMAFTRRLFSDPRISSDPRELPNDFRAPRVYGREKGVDDSPFVIQAGGTSDQGGFHGN
jgi:predicted amidophosphoribosyltransferase